MILSVTASGFSYFFHFQHNEASQARYLRAVDVFLRIANISSQNVLQGGAGIYCKQFLFNNKPKMSDLEVIEGGTCYWFKGHN